MNRKIGKKESKTAPDTRKEIVHWWALPKEAILTELKTDLKDGLPANRVQEHRKSYGANSLEELNPTSNWSLLIESLKQPMMVLLLSFAAISLAFGEVIEATVMLFVVAAYVMVEFVNKRRTDRTMARLRELTQPTTKVIRGGRDEEIPTAEVVVGDLVILTPGVRVPADARLMESRGLLVNEAILTGESLPARKNIEVRLTQESNLAERSNCVFSGTTVLDGEGKAVVLAVGQESEFGKIAKKMQAIKKPQTPMQQAMVKLSKTLAAFMIIVSFIIPMVGILRGLDTQQMILTWLALTFLMIPGQPPIIITMALALAAFELSKKQVIVKRLRGAETLGAVTAIITDKTGTLTENKMQVEKFILRDGAEVTPQAIPQDVGAKILLALPEHASDPTDKAILHAFGPRFKRENQAPLAYDGFSGDRPWRTITYGHLQAYTHAIAGKPELLVQSSTLRPEEKEQLESVIIKEGALGKRVVAYATGESGESRIKTLNQVEVVALAILEDPTRPGIDEAITTLKGAGIKTFIVTGDHATTTKAVADRIGLSGGVLTGAQTEAMDNKELVSALHSTHLFARATPSDKLRLVELLQAQHEDVAVIGDGINDAPAIKAANVGVAMGEIGTDLAKEAADLILTDDSFSHVSEAVAIGRKALDNFRKGLTYYLTAKAILLSIFIVPLTLGIPFPLAPIHIILIELLMDLASSTIFTTEVAEPNVLLKSPQRAGQFLNRGLWVKMIKNGALLAAGILATYLFLFFTTGNVVLAQTAVLVTWLLGHIFLALNLKQEQVPLFRQGLFSNRFGTFWFIGMVALVILVTNVPFFFPYMSTTYLAANEWFGILLVAFASTFWLEIRKWIRLKSSRTRKL